MSRQVDLEFSLNTKPVVTSMDVIIKKFEDLYKIREKIAPNGKIKMHFDGDAIKNQVKDFANLSGELKKTASAMTRISKASEKLGASGVSFNNTFNTITRNVKKEGQEASKSLQSFAGDFIALELAIRSGMGTFKALTSEMLQLTDNTYGVGVASQMVTGQIQDLNDKFLQLSRGTPVSAKGLAKATDDLVRTGRTYSEASMMMKEIAKLSVASGDPLKETAEVATKIMVSLGIEAKNTEKTLTALHSVAIQTASSMGGLSNSFKQFAGTLGVYTAETTASGEALDEYKQKILELGLSATGVLNNLGLSAGQAGTKVKIMFSKLISMEQTATKLFNEDMAKGNIYTNAIGQLTDSQNGSLLTADKLARLAKQNLPQAIQLLSQLQMQGQLSTRTLQKMFTGRHFGDISVVLREVGGNVDLFNKVLAQGVDYQKDYSKQMFNINNEIKTLKNNLIALGQGGFGYINTAIVGTTVGLNKLIGDANGIGKVFFDASTNVVGLGFSFLGIIKTLHLLGVGVKGAEIGSVGLLSSFKALNPVVLLLSATVTGLTYAWQRYNTMQREAEIATQSFIDTISRQEDIINKLTMTSKTTKTLTDNLKDLQERMKEGDFGLSTLESVSYTISSLVGTTSNWKEELVSVATALAEIQKPMDIDKVTSRYTELSADLTSEKDKFDKLKPLVIKSVQDTMFRYMRGGMKQDDPEYRKLIDKQVLQVISNMGKFVDVGEKKKIQITSGESMAKYIKYIASKDDSGYDSIDSSALKSALDDSKVDELIKTQDNIDKVITEMNELKETEDKKRKARDGYIQTADKFLKESIIEARKEQTKIFDKYGKIEINGKEQTGFTAVDHIFKQSFGDTTEGLKQYEEIMAKFKKQNSDFDFSQKGGLEYVTKMLSLLQQELMIKKEIALAEQENQKAGANYWRDVLRVNQENQNNLKSSKKFETEILEQKKNAQEYTFKYKSFDKDILSLELERAKIGQDIAYQSQLDYQYKIKQLEINKKIAEQEFERIETISSQKIDLSQFSENGSNQLSVNKATLDKLIAERRMLSAVTIQTGDKGKLNKEKVTELDTIIQAMIKIMDLEQKITLAPLVQFNKLTSDFPKQLEQAIGAMASKSNDHYGLWDILLDTKATSLKKNIKLFNKSFRKECGDIPLTFEILPQELAKQIKKVQSIKDKVDNTPKGAERDKLIKQYNKEYKVMEGLNNLEIERGNLIDENTRKIEEQNALYSSMGSFFGTLGQITGVKSLGQVGDVVTGFGELSTAGATGKLDFSKLFKEDGSFDMKQASGLLDSMGTAMQLGSMGGQLAGGVFGGNSQMGSDLGSIGAGIGMLVGGAGGAVVGGLLGGLAGGLLGGDSGNDQKEAQEKTREANRIYQENTEALNKLTNNMVSLNSGIETLNSSLLSSFSQLPTTGNLDRVTGALKDMNKSLLSNRDFGEIAYQITKSKKSGGGLFGGGSTVQWTETHTKSVQQMLNEYGYKGTINDMNSEELRDFSDWMKEVKIGENSNVKGISEVIAQYAEAMDKMEGNIDDFFQDATLEGFEGISSLAQKELRTQIESFYKNLGLNIDDEVSKEIDKLVEDMSVLVTAMKDVRSQFIDLWRETGKSSGDVFVSAMKPYMDSLLTNLSQVYYDVTFSDVTKKLDDSFKKISEELVELKKQGADLKWDDVTGKLEGTFDEMIQSIITAKTESESFNDVILALQKRALDAGLTLSDLFEMGLVTGTQGDVLEMFKNAVTSNDEGGALDAVGKFMGDKIGKALTDQLMDNLFSKQILEFSNQLDSVLSGKIQFSQLAGLMSQATSIGMGIEQQRLQMEALLSGFNFDSDITYTTDASKVEYSSGTSQQNTYVYNINSSVNAGTVVEADNIESLADRLLDVMIEKLQVDKGVNIIKNY